MKLDSVDYQILNELQHNALLTTKELASKLHLTPTPVFERVKRLEKEGYIKKYVAILDKIKLKKGMTVFCNVSLKEHARDVGHKFVKDILELKEVVECYNISGEYDFMLKVLVADMPEYQEFIMNKLPAINNIGSTYSIFVMGEIKNDTALPL